MPRQQVYFRAMEMKRRGAERIVFAPCITKGTPSYIEYPCPFAQRLKGLVEEKVQIDAIDWTN